MATRSKPKARKANPEPPKTITVELPESMPRGLDFRYDKRFGWCWNMTTGKGIDAFFRLLEQGKA